MAPFLSGGRTRAAVENAIERARQSAVRIGHGVLGAPGDVLVGSHQHGAVRIEGEEARPRAVRSSTS
jgi:hypothetical protein